jgi:hypothetical protein
MQLFVLKWAEFYNFDSEFSIIPDTTPEQWARKWQKFKHQAQTH